MMGKVRHGTNEWGPIYCRTTNQSRVRRKQTPNDVQCPRSRRIERMLQGRVYKAAQEEKWSLLRPRGSEGNSETHCINLRAAPLPQGNLSGRSNVFPNITSSEHTGFRNLPLQPKERKRQLFLPSQQKRKKNNKLSGKINTPNLNAPRNTLSLR